MRCLAMVLIAIITFSGCGANDMNAGNGKQQVLITTITPSATKSPVPSIVPTVTPSPTHKPSPTPQPAPLSQPASRQDVVEKLNPAALDKLDNTKLSWWEKLNNEHKTPGFPPEAGLVKKYGGIYIGNTDAKTVYLTFDEGYENGYTGRILDVLKANDVRAVFFITGAYLKAQPALVKRMLDEGHLVGNHTANHPSMPDVSYSTFEKEILDLERSFTSLFGKGMTYFRPPMGEYSERTLAAARELGYKAVLWSFHYLDYDVNNQKGADYAYNKVMTNLHNGAIMLLHAVSRDNTEALDRIIKDARASGYSFKLLDY